MRYLRRTLFTVVLICCSGAPLQAQSHPLALTLVASSNPVEPGALLTLTLSVTNTGATDLSNIIFGIRNLPLELYVRAIAPPGLEAAQFTCCELYDGSPNFIGTRVPRLSRGASMTLSVTIQVLSPPGATLHVLGLAAPSAGLLPTATTAVTVAGSGPLPTQPSQLVPGNAVDTGIAHYQPTDIALERRTGGYAVAGVNGGFASAPGIALLDPAGGLTRGPVDLAVPSDRGLEAPVLAYSDDVGASSSPGGVMSAWADAGHVYVRALETSTGSSSPPVLVGAGRDPQIAYAPELKRFLVVWSSLDTSRLLARPIAPNDGQPLGPVVELLGIPNGAFRMDPKLAWNPVTREFAMTHRAASRWPERAALYLTRLGGDGGVLGSTEIGHNWASSLSLSVNERTGGYVVIWHELALFGAELSGGGRLVSRGLITPETLEPTAVKYNPVSNTFLVVGNGVREGGMRVVELNQYGAPLAAPTDTAAKLRSPVLTSRVDAAAWRAAGSIGARLASQAMETRSAEGGSTARLGGCTSPDPFAAIGGGACHGGGWLAPGMFLPGPDSVCAGPDPFAALGGGTCVGGGWTPLSAPLSPPPPRVRGGCSTPDPFVAFGGGTCVNGGWLPPGMPVPAAAAPSGCSTPDPFVALGGGRCVGGGWLPPTMPFTGP